MKSNIEIKYQSGLYADNDTTRETMRNSQSAKKLLRNIARDWNHRRQQTGIHILYKKSVKKRNFR